MSGRRIVLASANPHKAAEFARLLPGYDVTPHDGGLPPETGTTFLANARLKALHVHRATGAAACVLVRRPAQESGRRAGARGARPPPA